MSNQHILFYSNNCPHSQEFIQLLNNSQYHNKFQKYCIEHMNKIPNGIFEVPTIIVPGFNMPLSGDNVFNWFQQNTQAPPPLQTNTIPEPTPVPTREEPPSRTSQRDERPDFSAPPSLGNPIEEPSAFGLEMSGFSDIYSYIEEGQEGRPLDHSFEFIGNNIPAPITDSNKSNIPQLPSTKTTKQSKGDILNKKYEEFMNSRNNDPVCNNSSI